MTGGPVCMTGCSPVCRTGSHYVGLVVVLYVKLVALYVELVVLVVLYV